MSPAIVGASWARITAERLVEHLARSGFVLMKQPPATAPSLPGSTPPLLD